MRLEILCIDDIPATVRDAFNDMLKLLPIPMRVPMEEENGKFIFNIDWLGMKTLEIALTVCWDDNPYDALSQIESYSNYDLVLVDDDWVTHGKQAGQEIVLPHVMKCLENGSLPLLALFTNQWAESSRVRSFCQLMSEYAEKTRIITGIGKNDPSGLLVLIQSVAIAKRMAQEHKERLRQVDKLARSNSQFVNALRTKLFGNDSIVYELARLIVPFEQWLTGSYEKLPKVLQRAFPTAILLEGEPGAGKTTICEAIATGLNSVNAILQKTLGPGSSPKAWEQKLKDFIAENYKSATKNKVVVIRADDLAWPSPSEISEKGLSADWEQYLRTIRDCLADAALINRGKLPEAFAKEAKVGKVEGKILWLFARNEAKDVGEMFEPLREFIGGPFIISFPRTSDARADILKCKADNAYCSFDPDALVLAVNSTMSYSGRDLVGDDKSEKGFLASIISRVQERETARFDLDDSVTIKMNIMVKEVNDWLSSNEHKGIISKTGGDKLTLPDAGTTLSDLHKYPNTADTLSKSSGWIIPYDLKHVSNAMIAHAENCLAAIKAFPKKELTLSDIGKYESNQDPDSWGEKAFYMNVREKSANWAVFVYANRERMKDAIPIFMRAGFFKDAWQKLDQSHTM